MSLFSFVCLLSLGERGGDGRFSKFCWRLALQLLRGDRPLVVITSLVRFYLGGARVNRGLLGSLVEAQRLLLLEDRHRRQNVVVFFELLLLNAELPCTTVCLTSKVAGPSSLGVFALLGRFNSKGLNLLRVIQCRLLQFIQDVANVGSHISRLSFTSIAALAMKHAHLLEHLMLLLIDLFQEDD